MNYPAVVYALDDIKKWHANGRVYLSDKKYMITVIETDPDSLIVDKMIELSKCRFDRMYIANNLYHYVFELYY